MKVSASSDANPITGLDHILIIDQDMERHVERFGRLGFRLTPQGRHEEWGTINQCVMFPDNYLELLAIQGKGIGAEKCQEFLAAKGAGLMGLVFGMTNTATAVNALKTQGIDALHLTTLHRKMNVSDGPQQADTHVVVMPPEILPGLFAAFVEQLTPQVIRTPEWLDHPNGACRLLSATVIVENPSLQTLGFNKIFGPAASTPTDDMITVRTGNSLLFIVNQDDFEHLHPDLSINIKRTPGLAAISIAVQNIAVMAALLKTNGIGFRHRGPQITITDDDFQDIGIEFLQV